MPMTLRIGAEAYSLTAQTEKGVSTFDLSKLNKDQLAGVREMVVNFWCRERGLPEVYHAWRTRR